MTTALHELALGWPHKWRQATRPTHEDDYGADVAASHTTANALPAYNTRRQAQEEPGRLRLARLPWSNEAPDRPAPDKPPTSQQTSGTPDIEGVGNLKEWDDIAEAIDNIRKDFAHSNNERHRKRRAEGGIGAEVLRPLIGDTILDTRTAQDASGIIDWSKVTVQDWTKTTPNGMNHTRIKEISTDFKDKEILYEAEYGVKDTSTCSNSVRISSHHSGAIEFHEKARESND